MKRAYLCLVIWAMSAAYAIAVETVYVTDQVTVAMRADVTPGSPVVKTVTTGTALEVLEQDAGLARVRDAQGAEGWVETSALSAHPPAGTQVKALRAELERTRAQLVQVQTQLDKSRAAASTAPATEQLQAELAAARAQLARAQAELQSNEQAASSRQQSTAPAAGSSGVPTGLGETGLGWLWLAIAFAMLVLGFIGGVVWVRESIRRRMGGLYLRI